MNAKSPAKLHPKFDQLFYFSVLLADSIYSTATHLIPYLGQRLITTIEHFFLVLD